MKTFRVLLILALPLLHAQDSPKLMAPDAKPVFEVSTIKPASPDRGFTIKVSGSGQVNTTSTSLLSLITFAYDLHPSQIAGAPGWLEDERFDIAGKSDTPGKRSGPQMKMMFHQLFADRLHLTFHQEKKDDPNRLMSFSGSGQQGMNVCNRTMAEFAATMQAGFLDRPVVDQTGFGNQRYNFILKWTPDSATANAVDSPDASPDIFTAFQEQLGLKLESRTAPVDVMVIDHVEKPGDN